jgi:hypothetical protein
VLSTTNLLLWLAFNFPDGLMVADLGIDSHKSCVHFVDSSRIGLCAGRRLSKNLSLPPRAVPIS